MDAFLVDLKSKLVSLNELEGDEFISCLKRIENEASSSPWLRGPYNIKQYEILLRPQRERAKTIKSATFLALEASLPFSPPLLVQPSPQIEAVSSPCFPNELIDSALYSGKDAIFQNLNNQTIYVSADVTLSALTLIQLHGCNVYVAGRVVSFVMVRNCVDCEVHVCSQQMRIHDSTNINFYVSCASDPVIERCAEMRFGPFSLGVQTNSELECNKSIKDFSWLRPNKQSPNWCLIPGKTKTHLEKYGIWIL